VGQVHNVDTWETVRQRWLDRFLCRWRTHLVAVSECVRKDVIQSLHLPPEKVRVLYNGVEIEAFADRSLRDPARAALGLKPDDIAIIYHGRLVNQKYPEGLLKIAAQVAARSTRVVVLVAGDGPRRADLEAAAKRQGLEKHIRFLGRRDDIPALLQASDIAVLPSLKEGFSNAIIEAMAAGLPVVATAVGGNAEAVTHGRNGWIVPPGNDAALLNAVAQLVNDSAERERMAVQSRLMVRKFSIERMIANVEGLYLDLAREARLL